MNSFYRVGALTLRSNAYDPRGFFHKPRSASADPACSAESGRAASRVYRPRGAPTPSRAGAHRRGLHVVDHHLAEARARHLGRAVEQTREVVGDLLGED